MEKYIDSEKLIANLERQNVDKKVIEPLIRIIDSLQQEQSELPKIARIRQEIERHRQATRVLNEHTAPEQMSKTCAIFQYSDSILSELLSFLNTLSEESDKSLEEAAEEYQKKARKHIFDNSPIGTSKDAFIAGAEWQKSQKTRGTSVVLSSEDLQALIDSHTKRIEADYKEKMLKDAVEGEAEELYNDGESQCTVSVGTYFKPGDKVYVLKAEEE